MPSNGALKTQGLVSVLLVALCPAMTGDVMLGGEMGMNEANI